MKYLKRNRLFSQRFGDEKNKNMLHAVTVTEHGPSGKLRQQESPHPHTFGEARKISDMLLRKGERDTLKVGKGFSQRGKGYRASSALLFYWKS